MNHHAREHDYALGRQVDKYMATLSPASGAGVDHQNVEQKELLANLEESKPSEQPPKVMSAAECEGEVPRRKNVPVKVPGPVALDGFSDQ